jgi:ribose 5-phosphate isomerase B
MKIAFGCDHAGFEGPGIPYRDQIIQHLEAQGHEVVDCGTFGPESVDYPDFAEKVCEVLLAQGADRGVLLCGTGMGISIAANRHRGIRAAVVVTEEMARLARGHNDANILCLGRRTTTAAQCLTLIDIFLATPFDGGERHCRRIAKLG